MAKLHTEAQADFPGGHVQLTVDCPDIGMMSPYDRRFVEEVIARMTSFVHTCQSASETQGKGSAK